MTHPVAPQAISKPLRRGTELRIRLRVLTASGAPQDITGAVFFPANVRTGEAIDSALVLGLTQTVVSLAGGIMDFSLTPTQTGTFVPGIDYWVSIYVTGIFTGGVSRLELHGKLEIIG